MIPTHIIIHHSLTKDGATVSWDAIRRYHTDPNGTYKMREIGYNFGLELIGNHYEILTGRMMNEVGAHCIQNGMNRVSLGICLIGNYDVDPVPAPVLDLLIRFVKSLVEILDISKNNVYRHSDFAPKSCPGKLFPWEAFKNSL